MRRFAKELSNDSKAEAKAAKAEAAGSAGSHREVRVYFFFSLMRERMWHSCHMGHIDNYDKL